MDRSNLSGPSMQRNQSISSYQDRTYVPMPYDSQQSESSLSSQFNPLSLETVTLSQERTGEPFLFDLEKHGDPRIDLRMYYDFKVTKTEAFLELQPSYLPSKNFPARIVPEKITSNGEKRHRCLYPKCTAKPFTRHYDLERHFKIHQRNENQVSCDYENRLHKILFQKDHYFHQDHDRRNIAGLLDESTTLSRHWCSRSNDSKSANEMAPRLVIAASSQSFDQTIISHWQEEGFEVRFEPVRDDSKSSIRSIESIGDTLESGEKYAIVAYGAAASILLRRAFFNPMPKLCSLVAFYPSTLPDPASTPPKGLRVQVHLAANQPFAPRYPSYNYASTTPGFAQYESGCFDKTASSLAWSRCLDCVRKGFGIEVDLETVWEKHLALEFTTKDAPATLKTMIPNNPSVNHLPTLTGGITAPQLLRFYRDFFIPCTPPSFNTTLLSRTIGSDRIVDELLVQLTHTCEMPWLLPGVPATGKKVEFVLVSVVSVRGGKISQERLHWDQATVLVQVGLLDAKLGAVGLGKNGVKRLPISGAEAARKCVDEGSVESNKLIPRW